MKALAIKGLLVLILANLASAILGKWAAPLLAVPSARDIYYNLPGLATLFALWFMALCLEIMALSFLFGKFQEARKKAESDARFPAGE